MSYRPVPQTPHVLAKALEQAQIERWLLDAALTQHRRSESNRSTLASVGWIGLTAMLLGALAELHVVILLGLGLMLVTGFIAVWWERPIWALVASALARGLERRRVRRMTLFYDETGTSPVRRARQECQARIRLLSWRSGASMPESEHAQLERDLEQVHALAEFDELREEYLRHRARALGPQLGAAGPVPAPTR